MFDSRDLAIKAKKFFQEKVRIHFNGNKRSVLFRDPMNNPDGAMLSYLEQYGLVQQSISGNGFGLSELGYLVALGKADLDVELGLAPRPAARSSSAIHVEIHGGVHGSPFQIGSPGAVQSVTINAGDVRAFLSSVRNSIDDLGLDPASKADLVADLNTADAQLQKSKPNETVLGHCLQSIQNVLEGAAATGLAQRAPELLAMMAAWSGG